MELSVPTNWDDRLIEKLKFLPVKEIFGKLHSDFFGGGRPSLYIPSVKKNKVKHHIDIIRRNGYKFNYLINTSCLDNLEFTRAGQTMMFKFLDWLVENGVDTVTVSIPYLLQWLKKNYPGLKVKASIIADIDTLLKANKWEDLGADGIILGLDCNRDFALLKAIVRHVKCEVALIVNLACLKSCAFSQYHYVLGSHASQAHHKIKHFYIDYCLYHCNYARFKDTSEIIRSGWIRPEDIDCYENIGIHSFKIVGRILPAEKIAEIAGAYSNKRYEGNLLEILAPFSGDSEFTFEKFTRALRYLVRPSKFNLSFLKKMRRLSRTKSIYIDNRCLDGFLAHFRDNDCRLTDCRTCGYCSRVAANSVQIDGEYKKKMLAAYKELLDDLETGNAFKSFF